MSEERTPRRPRLPKPDLPARGSDEMSSESALAVLQNRRFAALWLAQVATQVGANMVLFGLTVHIAERTGSTSAVSLLILTFLVPAVVFSAIAGVYVDRYDRRLILIVTNLLRAMAFLLMVVVDDRLAFIYFLNIFVSTVTTFFAPAEAAMIPVLVERRQLLAANGVFTFTLQASFMLGFALLGPLVVNLTGVPVLLLSVSLLYFAATGLCFALPAYAPPQSGLSAGEAIGQAEAAVAGTFAQLREGVSYIRANRSIFWSLTYLAITASLIGVLGVLGPAFAEEALGLGPKDFVVVVLPLGIGIVMGILLLNSYGRLLPRRRVIEGGLLAVAVTLALLSIAGPISRFLSARAETGVVDIGPVVSLLAIVVLLAFVVGVAYVFVAVPSQTQLQEELPEDVRGRVFGVLNMLVSIASFLPIILVGPIADLVGTPVVILLCALIVGVTGVVSIVRAHPALPASAMPGTHGAPVDPIAVTTVPLPHTSDELGALYSFSMTPRTAVAVPAAGAPSRVPRNLGFRQAADWVRSRRPTVRRASREAAPTRDADDGFFVAGEPAASADLEAAADEPAARHPERAAGAPEVNAAAGDAAVETWQPVDTAPPEPSSGAPIADDLSDSDDRDPALPAWTAQPVEPAATEDSLPALSVSPPAVSPPLRPPPTPPPDDDEPERRPRRGRPFAAREARSSSPLADRRDPAADDATQVRLPTLRPDPDDLDGGPRGDSA